jgi:hypothetical protein
MLGKSTALCVAIIAGTFGGATFATGIAAAGDLTAYPVSPAYPVLPAMPPVWPAVDAINEKFEGFGGSLANRSLYGVNGSLTAPVGIPFGVQIDGSVGNFGSNTFGVVGGHLFWRDPNVALFGIYGSETFWDANGGVNAGRIAAEGEYYWGHFTLQGIVGVEFGNSATVASTSAITSVNGIGLATTTTSTIFNSFNVQTRFFDEINFKYYLGEDTSAYIGHRYLGGRNGIALGGEMALPVAPGILGSAFVEARFFESDVNGVWGGVKFYFGPNDKPLMARHRQEDPNNWNLDSLYSITNNGSTTGSTTTSPPFCTTGFTPPFCAGL